nr:hypothetical protein EP46_17400 [Pantoea sp. 3.5.1]
MLIVLGSYLYCNYAVAAPPVQPEPAVNEPDNYAHVIVYRVDEDNSPVSNKVVSIFINNQYHTSILPHNRAVELILCPGIGTLDIAIGQLDKHRFGRSENMPAITPTLQAGKRYFYRIMLNKLERISAHWVSEKEADNALFNQKPQLLRLFSVGNEHCLK